MEMGTELSKTVATFIVQKIVMDNYGLEYVCSHNERFYALTAVLDNMVSMLQEQPSNRLLKHIIRVYLRLTDNSHAEANLRNTVPELLCSPQSLNPLLQDLSTRRWLAELLKKLGYEMEASQVAPEAVWEQQQQQLNMLGGPLGQHYQMA
eukprot:TRINITY_DN32397_c0_g1_i12.p1 TRINITY_DN32397_c0_g1~~TRINITY_DN32397_c0_g1_i12.p1  ORF type:complete len:150 (-),score=18.85 TRINITY_DN32397_c0_g1_i12:300-749(-)